MHKYYLFTLLIIPFLSIAQSPQKMSFQAVMRNANNTIISKSPVGIRISLLSGSPTGQAVYIESQTVQTDSNGLISLHVGGGAPEFGTIESIDWSLGPYFIKSEADPTGGSTYSIVGTSELLSVPYAMYALKAGVSTSGIPGPQGVAGINGLDGIKGLDGTNGIAGINGLDGIKGLDGTNGIAGINGLDGIKGLDGTIGIRGTNGVDGMNGLNGSRGSDGTNGTNGVDGINGLNGSRGSDGTNGTNGVDGTNGIDGTNSSSMEPIVTIGTTNQYYRGDKSWQTLNANAVNLANVENTTDLNKVISTNTQTALNLKSDLISPEFTGIPRSSTAIKGTNTTQIATTEFVISNSNEAYTINEGNELNNTSASDVVVTGLSLSPVAGKYLVQYNAQFYIKPVSTFQSSIDLDNLYNTLVAKTATNSTHAASYSDEILLPGVYTNIGAVTANGTITLNAQNNANAEFIFRFSGAFSTGSGLTILLANGASACNVYWIADGAIALGALTTFHGTLLAKNGAISLGNKTTINGGLFSTTGSIGIDETTINAPSNCTNYSDTMNKYGLFTSSGVITNVGLSSINGNIATHLGAITGFSTATINGSIFMPGITSTSASFSFYQNGVMIPFSTRTISADSNLSSVIAISSNATVLLSDTIDVRWKIVSGTIKMTNRILSALKIR